MRPTGSRAVEAYIPSRTKEKWVGAWDFKGKEDNYRKKKKNKCLVNRYLLDHTDPLGRREEL